MKDAQYEPESSRVSPLFGRANQMAGGTGGGGFSDNADNRRLEMQLRRAF